MTAEETLHRRHAGMVAATCFVLGFTGRGLAECFQTLVLPLSRELGFTRSEITSVYALFALMTGLAGPVVGFAFDRVGPRGLYAAGLLALGAGLLLTSVADQLWQFQGAAGIAVGFAVAALGNVPNAAMLGRWFRDRLATVTAAVFSSMGIGMLLLVPLAQSMENAIGWRPTWRVLGIGALILLIPLLALPWRKLAPGHPALQQTRATGIGEVKGWTVMRALSTPAFWGMFLCFGVTGMGMNIFAAQSVACLIESGIDPITAAGAWGIVGLLLPVGLIGTGWLDGRVGRLPTVVLSYGATIGALLMLWGITRTGSVLLLLPFTLLLGLSFGSRGPLLATISMRLFHGSARGTIYGFIALGGGLGSAAGALLGGQLHDRFGGYDAVIAAAILALIVGALPFWTVRALRQVG